jgi:predicted transport protein
MSDIKLFRINDVMSPVELASKSVALEKSLQTLIETHLEIFLGVRLLASEYSTGKVHRGRIDTLGIDENGCPVIIEYKRSMNDSIINQGLFYLNWLMDHQAEFNLLVQKKFSDMFDDIKWDAPRLICVAADFTRYDVHAVQQMNRNIDLIRYQKFGDEMLLFEAINKAVAYATDGGESPKNIETKIKPSSTHKTFKEEFVNASPEMLDRYEALKAYLVSLGDDVTETWTKRYVAFRRIKNFASVVARKDSLHVYLKIEPSSVHLQDGFTRDVSDKGHWGTGDLEIIIRSMDDFEKAKPFLFTSYEAS